MKVNHNTYFELDTSQCSMILSLMFDQKALVFFILMISVDFINNSGCNDLQIYKLNVWMQNFCKSRQMIQKKNLDESTLSENLRQVCLIFFQLLELTYFYDRFVNAFVIRL